MARVAGGLGALVCLVLLSIAMMAAAGCTGKEAGDTLAEGVCEKLSGLDRDHCYQNLARSTNNRDLCFEIQNPGPKSKCLIYLMDCFELSEKATGDGAYTRYDCYQYRAVQLQSVEICESYIEEGYRSGGNDLNPGGVSRNICIERVTENCGHIGQNVCRDKNKNQNYCLYGMMDMGKCVPKN